MSQSFVGENFTMLHPYIAHLMQQEALQAAHVGPKPMFRPRRVRDQLHCLPSLRALAVANRFVQPAPAVEGQDAPASCE